MRLISLTIDGRYKGLANQTFDFSKSKYGSVIAFIGLNGSGKSQLLELIAEIFALLERIKRSDFKVRTGLPEGIKKLSLYYEINDTGIEIDLLNQGKKIQCIVNGQDYDKYRENVFRYDGQILHDGSRRYGESDPLILPDYVIGYASGLHENLQRPFLKNAIQYHEIEKIKARREKELLNHSENSELDFEKTNEINEKYARNHKGIFRYDSLTREFSENSTLLSKMIYLDYDNASLLLFCLIILDRDEISLLFNSTEDLYPISFGLVYDINKLQFHSDAFRDLKLLAQDSGYHVLSLSNMEYLNSDYELLKKYQLVGNKYFDKDEFYQDEIIANNNYKKGMIDFLFDNPSMVVDGFHKKSLKKTNYNDPAQLFIRIYKTQLLGLSNWRIDNWKFLRKDSFIGTVKKPLKTTMPIRLDSCMFKRYGKSISYDDLSDGEVQLLTILAAIRIFSHDNRNVLFLLDEPETHLNPAWRTYYNEYLERAIVSAENTQILMTTHSPFMISSLRKEQVYTFEKRENNIEMSPSESETFGTSFDVLIKRYFGLKSSISQTAVTKIKEYLRDDSEEGKVKAQKWINMTIKYLYMLEYLQ